MSLSLRQPADTVLTCGVRMRGTIRNESLRGSGISLREQFVAPRSSGRNVRDDDDVERHLLCALIRALVERADVSKRGVCVSGAHGAKDQ